MNIYRVIIVLALLLISSIAPAQIKLKDSDEAYNYWAKRGVTELVYAYMNDVKTSRKLNNEEANGYEDYRDYFVEGIVTKSLADIDSNYKRIPQLLDTNDWSGTRKGLLDTMRSNFDNHLSLGAVFSTNTSKYANGREWKSKLDNILDGYHHSLDSISKNVFAENDSTVGSGMSGEVGSNNTNSTNGSNNRRGVLEDKTSLWSQLVGLSIYVFVFFMGALLALIYRTSIANKKESKLKDRISELKSKSANANTANSEIELRRKIQTLNDKVSSLELAIRKERELKTDTKIESESHRQNDRKQEEISQKKVELFKSVYFGMPEDDGSFYVDYAENSPGTRSYYEIRYKLDSYEGNLIYRGGNLDVSALNQMDAILFPVCNITSSNNKSPRKVKVLKNGTVRKVDDKWVVDRKVEIELV